MRVLLVQSYLGGAEPPVYPAALACLKPALAGHEVRAFDPNVVSDPGQELAAAIREFGPQAVGVSLRNIDSTNKRVVVFYYQYFKDMLAAMRKETDAPLIVGGSGFSMFADTVMRDATLVDFGVYLEGERTFPALLDNLDAPERVPSVFYRKDGKVRYSGDGIKVAGGELPEPDFSVLPLAPYLAMPWGVGLETKRGCALSCVYCPYGFLNGKAYRLKDPKRVADEACALAAGGAKRFTFLDSVFNIPKEHAAAVCRELAARKTGLRWSAWFNERELAAELLDLAVAAGCENVILSPDGFSDKALTKLGKTIRKADILRAFDLLKDRTDVEVSYNFFKNPPGQSVGAFLSMAAFVVRARLHMGRRAHFEFNSLRVEPHTALHKIALAEGVAREGDDLLRPLYYTQKRTAFIEGLFNAALRMAGK